MQIKFFCIPLFLLAAGTYAQGTKPWLLPNFSDRVEFLVSNNAGIPRHGLVILKVPEVRKSAAGFPGTLALCMAEEGTGSFLPLQVDDLDQDGKPDEVAVEIALDAHASRSIAIYYSQTLHDQIPYAQRVSASHAYGYNRATATLESELIGYRIYGGFLFDVQAHRAGRTGLFNSVLGYSRTETPPAEGRDIVHYGKTLGLGGIFIQSGREVFQPTFNTPDYTHKAAQPDEPIYRVVADGPLRAEIEASVQHWKIRDDEVAVLATYEMRAGEECIHAHVHLVPKMLTQTYAVGMGILRLPGEKSVESADWLGSSGVQNSAIGTIALGMAFDPKQATPWGDLKTKDGHNLVANYHQNLDAEHTVTLDYTMAAAWSGSGHQDLLAHVHAVLEDSKLGFTVSNMTHGSTPNPKALKGEPI